MFVQRDTHKQLKYQDKRASVSVTYENGEIFTFPLAVMPTQPGAVITPADSEGEGEASDTREDED